MDKIRSIETLVVNEFLFMEKYKEVAAKESICDEAYTSAFATILLCGYPAKHKDNNLVITGERIGTTDTLFCGVQNLKKTSEKVAGLVDDIINGSAEFDFKTSAEIEKERKEQEEAEKHAEEERLEAERRAKEEAERNAREEAAAKELVLETQTETEDVSGLDDIESEGESIVIEPEKDFETEETSVVYAFGLIPEDEAHRESQDAKFLSTMWFYKKRVTCMNKDENTGYGMKEFDIAVYPLEMVQADKTFYPVNSLVCITDISENRSKLAISDEVNGSKTVTIDFDGYLFNITGRYTNGKFTPKINLDPTSPYVITINNELITQNGEVIPEYFGKHIQILNTPDEFEFFPLYLDNKEDDGVTSCIYHHYTSEGTIEMGVMNGELITSLSDGRNKRIYLYWSGEEEYKKLMLTVE